MAQAFVSWKAPLSLAMYMDCDSSRAKIELPSFPGKRFKTVVQYDSNTRFFHHYCFDLDFMDVKDPKNLLKVTIVLRTLNTLKGYDRHSANPDWPDRNIPVGGWQLPFESFIGPDFKTLIFEGLKFVEHRYLVTEVVYREARAALFVLANMTPPSELFFLGS
jgi:hypothetical protein